MISQATPRCVPIAAFVVVPGGLLLGTVGGVLSQLLQVGLLAIIGWFGMRAALKARPADRG